MPPVSTPTTSLPPGVSLPDNAPLGSSLAPPTGAGSDDRSARIEAASEPRRPVGLERGEPSAPTVSAGGEPVTDTAVSGASAVSPGPGGVAAGLGGGTVDTAFPDPRTPDGRGASAAAGASTASAAGPEGVRFDPKEAMIERGWNEARAEVEAGKPRQALFILSRLYADPRLTAVDRRRLQDALDPLAAQVIYSQQHMLEQPFLVRRGDTLPAIAEQYRVPWQLLANINGVRDPEFLVPGTKLKVVRGPFRADVNLADQELTLHLNQLYAGRFPIAVGQDPSPTVGEFEIKAKSDGREFATGDGQVIPAGHPANPYGTMFMDIGRNLALHGSATAEDAAPNAGCISLSPRDALDVAGILSVGSTVTIRR